MRQLPASFGIHPWNRGGQLGDLVHVLLVLVPDRGTGAGRARIDGGVDEFVPVRQVGRAEVQQLHDAVAGACGLGRVVRIHATDGVQRVGHEGADCLVAHDLLNEP